MPARTHRWFEPLTHEDDAVLARAAGPVLDVGCGPGRHVLALAERGIVALGIDITPAALDLARSRGAPVLARSVFERVPGTGRWSSALLLDGNLGIDGVEGPWFVWTGVGPAELPAYAAAAGLFVEDVWPAGRRWFGALRRD